MAEPLPLLIQEDFFLEDEQFHEHVEEQVSIAIEDADVIVFVVDAQAGVTVEDKQVAQLLLKSKKRLF